MGSKESKPSGEDVDEEIIQHSQREAVATWHRKGVPVTDVYDIIELIGNGNMGEVYKVRRKVEDRGLHNVSTRNRPLLLDAEIEVKSNKGNFIVSKLKKKGKKSKKKEISPSLNDIALENHVEKKKTPAAPSAPLPKSILRSPSKLSLVQLSESNEKSDEDSSVNFDENTPRESSIRSTTSESELLATSSIKKAGVRFQRLYACKTVLTSRIKKGQLDALLNEIYIMRTLDHPYILHLHEVYQIRRKLFLVTELCTGGDLTSRNLNEAEVTVILEQILRALVYMHRSGICHSDIKLENILYEHTGADSNIRFIDFGLSKRFDRAVTQRKAVGTAYTLSPEIASQKGQYTQKTDIWAIGVVVWIILSGDFPFVRDAEDLNDKDKLTRLINARYEFGITWKGRGISTFAQSFVARCLQKKPEARWSAKDALEYLDHEWIPHLQEKLAKVTEKIEQTKLDNKSSKCASTHVDAKSKKDINSSHLLKKTLSSRRRSHSNFMDIDMNDIERFCRYGRMKKTILIVMANTMDRGDLKRLEEIFLTVDVGSTGTINLIELREALRNISTTTVDESRVEDIFKGIDHDQSGQICYAEFLAALAESQGLLTMNRLAEAFDRIDTEGKGYISHDDLKAILGKDYDKSIVDQMIKEADFKNNGQIDYEELLHLMFEDPQTGFVAVGSISIEQ
eukprot:CAMPEP_0197824004 /NCGR_PEP_ID=MMETSP1437-20131217/1319_1 /TAXON_ID=49252 ORGANISM="Eucampia antarctica, Strain CCMP1452" /NCGR_SAMPLE_ID=MMETSP1437 /ASSEMBLY_ACC=CAM_ASM_001096 /LENGTH=680 /DNA_ID=CAMNT_0043423463 /DNA_START=29 /DNA_END=2071 /DNA_ORIENTATION=-